MRGMSVDFFMLEDYDQDEVSDSCVITCWGFCRNTYIINIFNVK